MGQINVISCSREPWNRQAHWTKTPLKLKEIWAIRIRLQIASRIRDLALFDLAIDSKLRACDLVKLRVRDVCQGDRVATRAIVMQPLIYRRTKNLRAVQPLLGHKTLEGTVRYFGIEVDDALEMVEQMEM